MIFYNAGLIRAVWWQLSANGTATEGISGPLVANVPHSKCNPTILLVVVVVVDTKSQVGICHLQIIQLAEAISLL